MEADILQNEITTYFENLLKRSDFLVQKPYESQVMLDFKTQNFFTVTFIGMFERGQIITGVNTKLIDGTNERNYWQNKTIALQFDVFGPNSMTNANSCINKININQMEKRGSLKFGLKNDIKLVNNCYLNESKEYLTRYTFTASFFIIDSIYINYDEEVKEINIDNYEI